MYFSFEYIELVVIWKHFCQEKRWLYLDLLNSSQGLFNNEFSLHVYFRMFVLPKSHARVASRLENASNFLLLRPWKTGTLGADIIVCYSSFTRTPLTTNSSLVFTVFSVFLEK